MSSQLPWFRAYTEMIDDEKLRLLDFEDRWHFIALLCLKGQGVLDNSGPLLQRKVAVKMGLDSHTLEDVVRRLAEVGLVDPDTMQPLNWDVRQMRSDADPTAAERKRRQRARAKAGAPSDEVTVKSRVTDHDVTRTEVYTNEDKTERVIKELAVVDGGHDDASPSATLNPSTTAKTATRLPHDWVLPTSWEVWVQSERPDMTTAEVRKEADVFADFWHAKAGADAKKLDWQATWRNWIRRCNSRTPSARTTFGQQKNTGETAYQRTMRERAQEIVPSIARQTPEASPADFFKGKAIEVAARRIEQPQKRSGGEA